MYLNHEDCCRVIALETVSFPFAGIKTVQIDDIMIFMHHIGMFYHVRGWKMVQLLGERSHDTVLGFLKFNVAS